MHFSLRHEKYISHPFVTPYNGLILLNEALHPLEHERIDVSGLQYLEERVVAEEVGWGEFFHCEVVILNLANVGFDHDAHLEVE